MLLIRIPAFISSDILTIPELGFMIVGEKLTEGSPLYSQIWESVAPLSALFYGIIDYLFGRSQLTYQIVAYFLACYQVFIFNRIMLSSRAFAENTYIPAFIYAVVTSTCFDMYTLSPVLLGITFVLLALDKIFSHIEVRAKRDEDILNIGIYIGLATICYLPFSIFAICTLVIFILFTGTVGRRYALLTFGFFLPLILTGGYFYLTDRFSDFVYCFLAPLTIIKKVWYLEVKDTLILFSVPLAYFLLAVIRMIRGTRQTNYQSRLTQGMFVWFAFSGLFVVVSDFNAPVLYLVLAPAISFYLTHYFIIKKRGFFSEASFFIFVSLCIVTGIFSMYDSPLSKCVNKEDYIVNAEENPYESKRILILGENNQLYQSSHAASPFVNWQLSKSVFQNLNYYDNLTIINNGLMSDMPDVIIDPNGVISPVLEKVPTLKKRYLRSKNNTYLLRN